MREAKIGAEDRLAAYEDLVASTADVERKGKTTPYTSMNGNLFSFVTKAGALAFRLSKDDRAQFLERFPEAVVEQHGRLMKDYVEVPAAILQDEEALRDLWAGVVTNAGTPRPKATTRKKR